MTPKKRAARAAIYVRISKDSEGAGLGVKRQREACEALAKKLGHRVIGVYEDNDLSAYRGKPRPAYLRLLDDLRAGRIDVVVCWHNDRLHRSSRELLDYIDVCEAQNVTTQTCKAGLLDLSTHAGRLQAKIVGDVAEYESGLKSERIRFQKQQAAIDGKWRGAKRPYGYKAGGMHPEPHEAEVIREMADALLSGETCYAVAKSLNERGIPTSTGGRWSPVSIRLVVLRARNAGLSEHLGEIVGKGQWPPIILESEYYSLRALLTDPSRRWKTSNKVANLLAGMIECSVCGGRLRSATTTTRSGRHYKLYRCHVFPSAEYAENLVERWVQVLLCSPDAIRVLTRPKKVNNTLHRDIEILTQRLDDASKAYSRGDLSLSMLSAITKEVEPELERLRQLDTDDTSSRVLAGFTDPDVRGTWKGLSLARKRALIDFLVTITAHPGGKVVITPRHTVEVQRATIALSATEKDELARLTS